MKITRQTAGNLSLHRISGVLPLANDALCSHASIIIHHKIALCKLLHKFLV